LSRQSSFATADNDPDRPNHDGTTAETQGNGGAVPVAKRLGVRKSSAAFSEGVGQSQAESFSGCSPSPRPSLPTGSALDCVAQLSKAAVSPISKSACREKSKRVVIAKAPQVSKPAIQQARRPALPPRGAMFGMINAFRPSMEKRQRTGALQDLADCQWRTRSGQQGVALVITLILLSVITFMAVTFLVVSRRESEQVNTLTQQNTAKFAATVAADAAQSQVIALIQANTNGYNFGLLVSTNFLSTFFDNTAGPGYSSITNVNYNYADGKTNFSAADLGQLMNNLLVLPRVPVFFVSNRNSISTDFRFYLDLNHNGKYDSNGWVALKDDTGGFIKDSSGIIITNFMTGDPEWIGILNHPDMRHSSSNFFIGRYAFIALPIGNTLDINFIHNQSKQLASGSGTEPGGGFLRNQGVGSWEINLAGFLTGLNTNLWPSDLAPGAPGTTPYDYDIRFPNFFASSGTAFSDASAIMQFRYSGNYTNLRTFSGLYTANNPLEPAVFGSDLIDGYSRGPLMMGLAPLTVDGDQVLRPWSGDVSPTAFYTTQDLINTNAASPLAPFATRLYNAGTATGGLTPSTYNQYTFYRMLSQIGVESAPEPFPYPYYTKINLNYANVGPVATNSISSTNFVAWNPAEHFFTNAAIRLLRSRSEFTNGGVNLCPNGTIQIPIYPTNFYTPAVHRMLQLAANIYDGSTNRVFEDNVNQPNTNFLFYPSVFRPRFFRSGTGASTIIYINGYSEVTSNIDFSQPYDLRRPTDFGKFPTGTSTENIYGIPYVIGARSGFPHFNGYSMTPIVDVARYLQIVKEAVGSTNSKAWHTNVFYTLSISNAQNVACWYPNTNTSYSRAVRIYATNEMTMSLTVSNNLNQGVPASPRQFSYLVGNVPGLTGTPYVLLGAYTWQGSPILDRFYQGLGQNAVNTNSFQLPLQNLTNFIAPSQLTEKPFNLTPMNTSSFTFPVSTSYFVPRWDLTVTNRVRLIMIDDATGRLIDYVQLGGVSQIPGLDTYEDINRELTNADPAKITNPNSYPLWVTNIVAASNTVPIGFYNQIAYAAGVHPAQTTLWQSTNGETSGFNTFLYNGTQSPLQSNQVPFVATMNYTNCFSWSANDPLVHYTVSDLADLTQNGLTTNNFWTNNLARQVTTSNGTSFNVLMSNQRKINVRRYAPWNVRTGVQNPHDGTILPNQIAYVDPLIFSSSDWQFPTNKYPNVGWLGRVHRGTPWQTIYLKSPPMPDAVGIPHVSIVTYSNRVSVTNVYANRPSWEAWTGNNNYWPGSTNVSDAGMMEPTNDWKILDLFTAAPNENASRGQLSINQSGLAAWSAVLNGVIVVSNSTTPTGTSFVGFPIDPYTNSVAISNLVTAINNQRDTYPYKVFTSVGDVLSTPQLTVQSPFLNTGNASTLNDAAYERIPQQIMSLLRVGTPRYVIYAYGQSLKPADHSLIQASGPYFGICTNYQVTGEVLTRTVVRFEPTDPAVLSYPPAYANPNGTPNFSMRPVIESFAVLPPE
jgi:hypothetical protein